MQKFESRFPGFTRNFRANARAYLGALDEETQDRVVAHYISSVPPQAVGGLIVDVDDVHRHLLTKADETQQRELQQALQQARRKSLTTMIGLEVSPLRTAADDVDFEA